MGSWIKGLARTGYAARGLVYVLIGFFAVLAAFGRSEVEGTEGALQALLRQPFGTILVWFVAIGLAAFCVWRGVQAIRDTDNHGSEAKGIAIRAGLALGGLSYAVVALLAAAIATGSRSGSEEGGGGDPTGGWLAAVHEIGLGWLVVYGVAAVLFAVGAAHIVKGVRAGFQKYFRCTEDVMAWLRPLARFGLIARGIVFLIIGGLVVRGGLVYDVEERPGLAEALEAVQGYDYGWLILLAVALGLVAFGLYSLAEARYRRVTPD
ncbi:MAG TPA: DUF1206 domain-containing protein [Propylenella sp.]|nr:DUF1206 domain-containing protein [Propylenella sp.]